MSMKRVVDYPRLYDSAKLASLPSDELRAEYVWLLGVAGPNGSFEWSPRRLWASAYASIRDVTEAQLAEYLAVFLDAGLLVEWEQDGKVWGYFTGSEVPGRLPRDSWKERFAKSGKMAPPPPAHLLPQPVHAVSNSRQERGQVTDEACNKRDTGVPLSLSESLSETEAEAERSRAEDFDGQIECLGALRAYPKSDKTISVPPPETSRLYMELIDREAPARGGKREAADWFLGLVREYARQNTDTEPKYIQRFENFVRSGYADVRPADSPADVPTVKSFISDEPCLIDKIKANPEAYPDWAKPQWMRDGKSGPDEEAA